MARHRNRLLSPFKRFYLRTTGYSYPNMGRLFLRLFIGIMLLQFGLRQMSSFNEIKDSFPAVLGMTSELSLIIMIFIETVCSACRMVGMFTRILCAPPFIAMAVAEYYLLSDALSPAYYELSWQNLGYLPIIFKGIYFFLALVGPGKLSIAYFLSLHIIHAEDRHEAEELEQM